MKLFLFASLLALCSASALLRTRSVSIGDDGSLLIVNSVTGKRIQIAKNIDLNGQRTVEIKVASPTIPTRTIEVPDVVSGGQGYDVAESKQKRSGSGSSKVVGLSEIVNLIFKDVVGPVTDAQWEKLLGKLQEAVIEGQVIPQLYDLLVGLDLLYNNYIWEAIQQGRYVFGQGPQVYGQGLGQASYEYQVNGQGYVSPYIYQQGYPALLQRYPFLYDLLQQGYLTKLTQESRPLGWWYPRGQAQTPLTQIVGGVEQLPQYQVPVVQDQDVEYSQYPSVYQRYPVYGKQYQQLVPQSIRKQLDVYPEQRLWNYVSSPIVQRGQYEQVPYGRVGQVPYNVQGIYQNQQLPQVVY